MARMSYISSVERYHEYEHVIHSLLESILCYYIFIAFANTISMYLEMEKIYLV